MKTDQEMLVGSSGEVSLEALVDQASAHLENEEWAAARDCLEKAALRAPGIAVIHSTLAGAHFRLNEYGDSARAYGRAIKLDPENFDLLTQGAIAYLKAGQIVEGEGLLRRALAINPSDPTVLDLLESCRSVPSKVEWAVKTNEAVAAPDRDGATAQISEKLETARASLKEIKLDAGLTLEIGDFSYVHGDFIRNPSGAQTHLKIGKFCSIATDLTIIGYDHRSEWITMYPFLDDWHRSIWPGTEGIPNPGAQTCGGNLNRGDITIGSDVWIGHDVKIFKGVTIGHGAVIGACSLVNKDVPPYTVVAGVPARPIRKRFSDEQIECLLSVEWWGWDAAKINRHLPLLCSGNFTGFKASLSGTVPSPSARPVPPVESPSDAQMQNAQDTIQGFINKARDFFKEVQPPRLDDNHLKNSRILPNRKNILDYVPKGGVCAEIGTQTGRFAKAILAVLQPAKFHIYDLDFTPFDRPHFAAALRGGVVELHRGDSAALLATAPDKSFDFIYVDGDHAYEGVARDLAQAARKIKDDGWIVCNDYTCYSPLEQMKYGVYRAVNELCLREGFEIIFLGLHPWGYHDVALRKIGVVCAEKIIASTPTL